MLTIGLEYSQEGPFQTKTAKNSVSSSLETKTTVSRTASLQVRLKTLTTSIIITAVHLTFLLCIEHSLLYHTVCGFRCMIC